MKCSLTRKEARTALSKNLVAAIASNFIFILILLILNLGITYLSSKLTGLDALWTVVKVLLVLFIFPLGYGIAKTYVKIANNEKVTATSFIGFGLSTISKSIGVFVNILIKVIPASVVVFLVSYLIIFGVVNIAHPIQDVVKIISMFVYVAAAIAIVFITIRYSFSLFVLAEDDTMKAKDAVNKSKEILNGKVGEYVILLLSFIGWFILYEVILLIIQINLPSIYSDLFSFIPTIFLTPYILMTQYCYYDEAKADLQVENSVSKEESTEEE